MMTIKCTSLSNSQTTLKSKKEVALFEILRQSQSDYLLEIDPQFMALSKRRKPDDFVNELNQLIHDIQFLKLYNDNGQSPPEYSKL